MSSPTDSDFMKHILEGAKRRLSVPIKKKDPITPDLLSKDLFESKSGVIGSFFLIGTDKRLFAPSKICFIKSESVGELILAILCAHLML
jgi:hypothetical protein